ncbi:hypothetical protein [Burkholderia cenocepacia]|uniref:hypothetical protein n=1 Tax=Burkholderia cenocepacia TaxID=95486 RepID=UPI001FC7D9DC|nr:hypothetical protein [Burkholderia cenocepacia]
MQVRRRVAQQVEHRVVDDRRREAIEVVEHQEQLDARAVQFVEQFVEYGLQRNQRAIAQQLLRAGADPAGRVDDRGDHVGREDRRVVVVLVETHPRDLHARRHQRVAPLGQQRGLAVTGRRAHERQPAVEAAPEPPEPRDARHDPAGRRRRQLGAHQHFDRIGVRRASRLSAVRRRHAVPVLLAVIACPPARQAKPPTGPVSPCAENSITIRRRPSKVGDVRTGVGARCAYRPRHGTRIVLEPARDVQPPIRGGLPPGGKVASS